MKGNGAPRIPGNCDYGWRVLTGMVLVIVVLWGCGLFLLATATNKVLPGPTSAEQAEQAHAKERDSTRGGDWSASATTATVVTDTVTDR